MLLDGILTLSLRPNSNCRSPGISGVKITAGVVSGLTIGRREVGLKNDYPRHDESLLVLVGWFSSLQPLAGAEFLK